VSSDIAYTVLTKDMWVSLKLYTFRPVSVTNFVQAYRPQSVGLLY